MSEDRSKLKYAEEGDKCPECESGRLLAKPTENCSCHISPPCWECTNPILVCPECKDRFNGGAPPERRSEPKTVQVGFELVSAARAGRAWDLKYVVSHTTPGREGTRLEVGIQAIYSPDDQKKVKIAEVYFGPLEGNSLSELLGKLHKWVGRTAEALDGVGGLPEASLTGAFDPVLNTIIKT